MSKDYYKILGIDKNASQEEVKKAFRKKAHEHHPDKAGGDEAKFKEINEAYQVLGDAKKKEQSDRYGSAFEHGQAGGGFQGFEGFRDFSGYTNGFNVNMDDIGDIFGGIGDIFGFNSGRGSKKARQGRDIEVALAVDFSEAVSGAEKEISLRKTVVCDHCRGNGAEPGSKMETCKACGGTGRIIRVQRTILGNVQMQMVCDVCGGEGQAYSRKCSKCSGSGVSQEIVNLKIKIPAGIDNGETIRSSGQGEAGEKGGTPGDLYINIRVNPDKRFTRDKYDIKSKIAVSFTQAALGDKIDIETVAGPVSLKIPSGTQSGTIFRLKEKGIQNLHGRGRGDHFVEIQVKVPTDLSWRQKDILRELGV
jgi:molecular chaperone DnaJ